MMNHLKLILATATIGFFAYSCGGNTPEQSNQPTETVTDHEHQHSMEAGSVELNNGEKWLVNDEMKPYVTKGVTLLDEYTSGQQTDYFALAEQLSDQNNLLVKSCTMKGKSHDELHKWLHPHMELVAMLGKAPDNSEANELIVQLKESYNQYNQYFQ